MTRPSLLAALACLSLSACAAVPTVELRDWQLVTPEESAHVRLPSHLGHGLEDHEST